MKNPDKWKPSKYVMTDDGRLRASRDIREVGSNSRFVADLTAAWYGANIKEYVRGALLDLGCGKAPLYGAYAPLVSDVTLADWENSLHNNQHLDVVCDISNKLPFKSNSFDTVILSDVLEHIPNPNQTMSELARILKPGGHALINVPFFYRLHEVPHDYHRYTEFMLEKLAKDNGMSVTKIDALGGGYAVLIDLTSKLWGGRRATVIQKVLPKIWKSKLKARTEFPIAYAMVCRRKKGKV